MPHITTPGSLICWKRKESRVIGYRRHTHKTPTYDNPYFDACICPEHKHLYRKTITRESYRQYFCDSKTCKACPRRTECFGASMTR